MIKLTARRRANLLKLANYLETLPKDYRQFSMNYYNSDENLYAHDELVCDAVACAIGHAPAAGIRPKRGETWLNYCERTLIGADPANSNLAWQWMFSLDWQRADNTPHGAAARIRWYIEHGVPENFGDQMCGEKPLCYEVAA